MYFVSMRIVLLLSSCPPRPILPIWHFGFLISYQDYLPWQCPRAGEGFDEVADYVDTAFVAGVEL